MVRITISLDEKLNDQIKAYAKKHKISRSKVVRDAIKEYIKQKKEMDAKNDFNWVRNSEKYATNMGGNVASHIDDILYS